MKELIERLRLDAERLRNPAKLEQPHFRWTGERPNGYRYKSEVADDIEALIALVENTDIKAKIAEWEQEWIESNEPHWGDDISWKTAHEIAIRLEKRK